MAIHFGDLLVADDEGHISKLEKHAMDTGARPARGHLVFWICWVDFCGTMPKKPCRENSGLIFCWLNTSWTTRMMVEYQGGDFESHPKWRGNIRVSESGESLNS